MVFHEVEPGTQPLHVLPRGGDPLSEGDVFPLEQADALPGLGKFGTPVNDPALGGHRGEILLRLLAASAPSAQLILDRGEEALEFQELGLIRPNVG
jgi:hypothetical protein